MELTEYQIDNINKLAPNDWQVNEQGIYKQPYGIPTNIKGYVIYMRWETGGKTGGGYHEDSCLRTYTSDNKKPKFKVLDLVLQELMPSISFLQYREIEELIKTTDYTDNDDYYGNCTYFDVEYIILDELLEKLKSL